MLLLVQHIRQHFDAVPFSQLAVFPIHLRGEGAVSHMKGKELGRLTIIMQVKLGQFE
jgi:hypothetical protein